MVLLVTIHVLSAMLGLGPAYAFPFILRKVSTLDEMKRNLLQVASLEVFPKIFGSLAFISGLALFFIGSYGPFMQVWIIGSLAVFAAIEILVIVYLNPAAGRLIKLLAESETAASDVPAAHLTVLYTRVRNLHLWSGILGILLLILMIVKPQ
ncbi:DUF2269 family protein [Paenibacillus hamazuiensis]|uniref:DUF2269 family protein n=1 Tax=Paenibacillus hamazuiensis TaxID=2936508 RepID=UPI00201069D4|nr:DUF2269 family protein [Paenibacillus hamazuiensis]